MDVADWAELKDTMRNLRKAQKDVNGILTEVKMSLQRQNGHNANMSQNH